MTHYGDPAADAKRVAWGEWEWRNPEPVKTDLDVFMWKVAYLWAKWYWDPKRWKPNPVLYGSV